MDNGVPVQQNPDFFRLSKTLRDFILTRDPAVHQLWLKAMLEVPDLAEVCHDFLKKKKVK